MAPNQATQSILWVMCSLGAKRPLSVMGTINNEGTISLENSNGVGDWISVSGDVTLQGRGHITLTNSPVVGLQDAIFGTGVLTNVDNVISGNGVIGNYLGFDGTGTFLINEAAGVVDANQSTPLFLQDRSFTNAGLIEATHNGTLVINNAAIKNFLECANGTIDAAANSTISLEDASITGGFVTVKHGGILEAGQGSNTISGAVIANEGTLGTEGGNLTIVGNVNNTKGTLDANNATLAIDGAVCGGKATIEGTGEIEFGGGSSARRVTFAANSDGILKLDAPSTFTGKVSGLTAGTYIDLPSIGFGAHTTLGYSENAAGTGGTLAITDGTHTADIALLGNYMASTFATASDGHGGTLITQAEQTATASQHLLTTPHSG